MVLQTRQEKTNWQQQKQQTLTSPIIPKSTVLFDPCSSLLMVPTATELHSPYQTEVHHAI